MIAFRPLTDGDIADVTALWAESGLARPWNDAARDIDFAAALEARLGGTDAEAAAGSASQYRIPVMPSLDGNTVEMSVEQTAFAETAVSYSATLDFLRGRIDKVTRALRGE